MTRDTGQMPRQTPRLPGPAELVRHRLAYERDIRHWSTSEVARRLTESGFKISQSSVWSIESDPRRKVTFAEAVAFADLYELELDELLQVPRDITGEDVARLIQEIFAVQHDARALLSRLTALTGQLADFNESAPEALFRLLDYLGISEVGAPTDKLKKELTLAADLAGQLADALPEQAIAITFRRDDESEGEP